MTTLFMHKKGERRNDKSRRAHQRKRDKAWAKKVLRSEVEYPEQFRELAREILAKGGR